DLALELLRSAKRARWQAHARGGWVDFLVIEGEGSVGTALDDWRPRRPAASGGGRERGGPAARGGAESAAPPRLGAAPYTWRELEGLLTSARALHAADFPRPAL